MIRTLLRASVKQSLVLRARAIMSEAGKMYSPVRKGSDFARPESKFRHWVTADGSSGFKAEANRYHLYVSYACPWAHRTLIVRKLKGLEDAISFSVVHWLLGSEGWKFDEDEGTIPDTVNHAKALSELYKLSAPTHDGRVTVPVLWDKQKSVIVNNESSEIIRMLNSEFNAVAKNPTLDLYPERLRSQIDEINAWVYDTINNGVYKAGFAGDQAAYEKAVVPLFESLDRVEDILSRNRYLTGDQFTLADVRLFTTLLRFDPVYHGHFKCNLYRIVDKPNMLGFLREIAQLPGITETINMMHIKRHYYMSHTFINPSRIVPLSNGPDLSVPHGRDRVGGKTVASQLTAHTAEAAQQQRAAGQ